MGGGKRDKFSRYHTDEENETSSESESSTSPQNLDEEADNSVVNQNNSNTKSSTPGSSGKQIISLNRGNEGLKYLETRSKRKYNKPDPPKKI